MALRRVNESCFHTGVSVSFLTLYFVISCCSSKRLSCSPESNRGNCRPWCTWEARNPKDWTASLIAGTFGDPTGFRSARSSLPACCTAQLSLRHPKWYRQMKLVARRRSHCLVITLQTTFRAPTTPTHPCDSMRFREQASVRMIGRSIFRGWQVYREELSPAAPSIHDAIVPTWWSYDISTENGLKLRTFFITQHLYLAWAGKLAQCVSERERLSSVELVRYRSATRWIDIRGENWCWRRLEWWKWRPADSCRTPRAQLSDRTERNFTKKISFWKSDHLQTYFCTFTQSSTLLLWWRSDRSATLPPQAAALWRLFVPATGTRKAADQFLRAALTFGSEFHILKTSWEMYVSIIIPQTKILTAITRPNVRLHPKKQLEEIRLKLWRETGLISLPSYL